MIEPLSEVPAGAIRFVNGNRLSVCPVSVMLILEGTPEENGIRNYNTFSGDTMDTNAIWRNNCNLTEPYNFLTTVCLNYANPDCVPAGYTHLSITNLVPVDPFLGVKEEEYYDLKRRLANEMMEQYIKIGGVDFRGRIAEIEVSTPMTISHYVGAWKGSIFSMDNHVRDGGRSLIVVCRCARRGRRRAGPADHQRQSRGQGRARRDGSKGGSEMSIRVKSFLKDVGGAGRVTEARRKS